jgi:hypothetical protein
MDKKSKEETNKMWIPSHSGITEDERADEEAKNALEKDINDQELHLLQDLINWMKKTDAKNRQESWGQGENTIRVRKETIEWKDGSTNLSRKEQVVVSRLRTGYTRATHRHVIEKTPSPECPLCGVSLTTKHIYGSVGNYEKEREREEKNRNHERFMDRWNRRTEKTEKIEHTKKIGLFHRIWTRTTCGRSRTNHKQLQREEYKWRRTLIKKEKEI